VPFFFFSFKVSFYKHIKNILKAIALCGDWAICILNPNTTDLNLIFIGPCIILMVE